MNMTNKKLNGEIIVRYYNGNGELEAVEIKESETDINLVYDLTPIPNFSNLYADLENGKIWNDNRSRFSNLKPNRNGYCYSSFVNNQGNTVAISEHSLIMSAFVGAQPNFWQDQGMTVNHINFDKKDNRIKNLELIEFKDQFCDVVRSKMGKGINLTKKEIQEIKFVAAQQKLLGVYKINDLCNTFASKFNKNYNTIYYLLKGETHVDIVMSDKQQQLILELTEQIKQDKQNKVLVIADKVSDLKVKEFEKLMRKTFYDALNDVDLSLSLSVRDKMKSKTTKDNVDN